MAKVAYKRILIKLSGEALAKKDQGGIDPEVARSIASQIKEVHDIGVDIGIVVGGGNILRGTNFSEKGMDRVTADYMGMLGTVINALALQDAIEKFDVGSRVMSALRVTSIAEPFIKRRATRHIEKGRVVIFCAGTGNPYFTTDTAAALRASEIDADIVLKGTKVNGVYDSDPMKNPKAVRFEKISYADVISKNLRVMDTSAISLCMENSIPIIVFDIFKQGNLKRVVYGERIGTYVSK